VLPLSVGAQMRHIKLTTRVKTLARRGLKKFREVLAADAEPTPELDIEMIRAALQAPTPLAERMKAHVGNSFLGTV
jgi:hypothetical protein